MNKALMSVLFTIGLYDAFFSLQSCHSNFLHIVVGMAAEDITIRF